MLYNNENRIPNVYNDNNFLPYDSESSPKHFGPWGERKFMRSFIFEKPAHSKRVV